MAHGARGYGRARRQSGGGGGTASLAWGPDFGDFRSLPEVLAAVDLATLALAATAEAQAALAIASMSLTASLNAQAAADLTDVDLSGTLEAQGAVDLASASLDGTTEAQAAAAIASTDLAGATEAQGAVDLTDAALDGSAEAQGAVQPYVYDVTDMAPQEDTWLDEANPDSTHGGDTLLSCRQADLFGNQARNAYVAFDLTGLPAGAEVAETQQIVFDVARDDGLTDANLNFEVYTNAAKPFEEDNATWNNDEPPPGTQQDSGSFDNLGTSRVTRTYTIPDAVLNAAVGNWLYVRFIGETGLGNTIQFSISSKESASPPALTFSQEVS